MSNLANYAVTYNMSVNAWNPSITSKEVKRATADKFSCRNEQTTGGVYLILKEYTEPLQKEVRVIRTFFDKYTVKLSTTEVVVHDDGSKKEESVKVNIIPSHNFWRVSDFTQTAIPRFDRLTQEFLNSLGGPDEPNSIIGKSIAGLGSLGTVLQARGMKAWVSENWKNDKIYFKFSSFPMADPDSLGNLQGITDDVRNALVAETKIKYDLVEKAATKELNSRLADVLDKFIGKMKTFDPDGKSRMHDSIISNIGELVEVLPSMVLNDDRTLVNLCNEASLLTNWDVELLKENEYARKEAAQTAEDIRAKLVF